MRLKEALAALAGLIEKKSRFAGTTLAIPLARNRWELEALREGHDDMLAPSEQFKKYRKEHQELVERFSVMRVVGDATAWVIEDEKKLREFQRELAALRKEYAVAIEEQEAKIERANEAMKKNVDVKLHKIKESDLPKDLNDEEVYILLPFIE